MKPRIRAEVVLGEDNKWYFVVYLFNTECDCGEDHEVEDKLIEDPVAFGPYKTKEIAGAEMHAAVFHTCQQLKKQLGCRFFDVKQGVPASLDVH